MGGMIAQVLAGSHPDRFAVAGPHHDQSGRPFSAVPRWRVIKLAFDPPAKDAPAEEKLAFEVRNISVINGPNFLPPDDRLRRRVEELTARSDYPQGMLRQFDAILGTGSLVRYTRRITAPTVVIHGSAGSDDAAAKRAQPGPGHRRRTLRGGRRHGSRPARAGVAPGRRSAHGELSRGG